MSSVPAALNYRAPAPLTVQDRVGNQYVSEPTPIKTEDLPDLVDKYDVG